MRKNKFAVALVAFVLMFAMLACTVCADGTDVSSKSDIVDVSGVDEDGKNAELTITELGKDDPLLPPAIAASILNDGTTDGELAVLWQKDVTAAKLPVTLLFRVAGTDKLPLYVYHYNGSAWELVASGVGPEISAKFTSLSPVALVVKKIVKSTDTSPNTGVSTDLPLVAFAAVLTVAGLALRKRED